MTPLPASEIEIDEFLTAFESGTLPKERWTHAAHLLAGACYVHRLGQSSALKHMRMCVRRYNEAVGGKNTATSGYHETITVFWIKVLDGLLLHAQHSPWSALHTSETSSAASTTSTLLRPLKLALIGYRRHSNKSKKAMLRIRTLRNDEDGMA